MRRRWMSAILALTMALALTACGGDSSSSSSNDSTPAESTPAAPAVEIPPVEDLTGTDTSAIPGLEDGVLTVGMECAYAPYNWTQMDDSNGAVPISNVPGAYANGYDVMIAQRICEAYGWELEIVSSAWDSLCPAVQSGTMDANIAGQSMTADRMNEVDMAGPYYYATIVCLTTEGQPLRQRQPPSPISPAAPAPPSPAPSGMTPACPRSTSANIHRPRRQRPRDDHAAPDRHGGLSSAPICPPPWPPSAKDDNLRHPELLRHRRRLPVRLRGGARRERQHRHLRARRATPRWPDAINSRPLHDDRGRLQRPDGSGHRHPARDLSSAGSVPR